MSGILGGLAAFTGTVQGVNGLVGAISNLASGNYASIISGLGPWAAGLQVASFRGIPFAVHESSVRKGRRNAVHTYPFRDEIWVEDLGRGVRRYGFRGFLVGDDVFLQSSSMQAAAEQPGPGTLVHPSLGSLTCSVAEFTARESAEHGRVVELEFDFLESASSLYPALVQSTQQGTKSAASNAWSAISSDWQTNVAQPLAQGAQVVNAATQTVTKWTSSAMLVAGDASLLVHSVSGLAGNQGRYNSASMTLLQPTTATVPSLLAGVTTARTAVTAAAGAAQLLGTLL